MSKSARLSPECRDTIRREVGTAINGYRAQQVAIKTLQAVVGTDCSEAAIRRLVNDFARLYQHRSEVENQVKGALPRMDPRTILAVRDSLCAPLLRKRTNATVRAIQQFVRPALRAASSRVENALSKAVPPTKPFDEYDGYLRTELWTRAVYSSTAELKEFIRSEWTSWAKKWPQIQAEIASLVNSQASEGCPKEELYHAILRAVWAVRLMDAERRHDYVKRTIAIANEIVAGEGQYRILLEEVKRKVERLRERLRMARLSPEDVIQKTLQRMLDKYLQSPMEATRIGKLAQTIARRIIEDEIRKIQARSKRLPVRDKQDYDWKLKPFAEFPVHQSLAWILRRLFGKKARLIAKDYAEMPFSNLVAKLGVPLNIDKKLWEKSLDHLCPRFKQLVASTISDEKTLRLYDELRSWITGDTYFGQYITLPKFNKLSFEKRLDVLAAAIKNWETSVSRRWHEDAVEAIYFSKGDSLEKLRTHTLGVHSIHRGRA